MTDVRSFAPTNERLYVISYKRVRSLGADGWRDDMPPLDLLRPGA